MENEYLSQFIEECWINTTFLFKKIWKRAFNNYILLPYSSKEFISEILRTNSLSSFSAGKSSINTRVLAVLRSFSKYFLSAWFSFFPKNIEKDLQRMAQGHSQKQPFPCVLYRSSWKISQNCQEKIIF